MSNSKLKDLKQDYTQKYGFSMPEASVFKTRRGLGEDVVRDISKAKNEPQWMLDFRLRALKIFDQRAMPNWGADLSEINFNDIIYYHRPGEVDKRTWDDVPESVKATFERLGIPQAEREYLSGVKAQYDSEVTYSSLLSELEEEGVIFLSTDEALKKYPHFFDEYFGKVISAADNKFSALNSAVWSGGSFVYIPKGVHVKRPLQAYFRINAERMGQFERTLIIADEGSYCHYVEGCTSPTYSTDSLHSAVVEVIVKKGARFRYTTIQNWSNDVYNLVTKRARVEEDGIMEWIDGNLGCLTGDSKVFINNGLKEIKNIKSGDHVFSVNENFEIVKNKVIATKYSGKQQVYKLTTENSREINATANHPFLVLKKRGKDQTLVWTPLADINDGKQGDLVAISGELPDYGRPYPITYERKIGTKKDIKYPSETTVDLMWLLGFYIGDGYYDRSRVYFAVPDTDKSNIRVRNLVKEVFDLDFEKQKGVVLRVSSANLIELIKKLGFSGNARTKRLPDWVFTLPREQKLALIDGYIAADGYIIKGHKNISITSVNKPLLGDVKILAMSCGLNPKKILDKNIHFSRVTKIEPLGVEDTYDIEVEDAHNFISNGILVHNSKVTMKYPSCFLVGPRAHGEVLSIAYAGKGMHQDAGAKMIHVAPNTTSTIISKSVSAYGGRTSYRGLVHIAPSAPNSVSHVECDALILDSDSASDTFPTMRIQESGAQVEHEATVSKIGEEKLFYLMSRGLSQAEAMSLIVSGFIEPIVKELPMEYSIELNRLIELEMEGSVG